MQGSVTHLSDQPVIDQRMARKPTFGVDEARRLATEAGWTPTGLFPGAQDKSWVMRCSNCGTESTRSLRRILAGSRCRACANTLPEDAAAEARAAGLIPEEKYPGRTDAHWLVRCSRCEVTHHRTLTSIRSKRQCRTCRYLSPQKAEESAHQHGWQPLERFPGGSNTPWLMRCKTCGWEAHRTLKRVRQGYRCKSCIGWRVKPDGNEELVRRAGFTPLQPYSGRTKDRWRCRCETCGKTVAVLIAHVARGHGCGYCSGRLTDEDEVRDEMLSYGFEPLVPYPGSHVGWRSRCLTCRKVVAPHFANIRGRKGESGGCGFCSQRAIDPVDAVERMDGWGWVPLEDFPGAREPWKCRCKQCGKISLKSYKTTQRGHGCKFCDKQGFDYSGPAHLYVMINDALDAVKVGISGVRAQRSRHSIMKASGWELMKRLPCETGQEARLIEQAVLRHLRVDRGLLPVLTNEDLPQNGATETFSREQLSALDLWNIVQAEATRHRSSGVLEADKTEPLAGDEIDL